MKKTLIILLTIFSLLISVAAAEDLGDFPEMFISGNNFNAKIVVGDNSGGAAALGAAAITASAQSYSTSLNQIQGILFEGEISNTNQNMILIGRPSEYSTQSNTLIDKYEYPEMNPGEAYLKLIENGDNLIILVTGVDGDGVRAAANALANYDDYNLNCDTALVKGSVTCTDTAIVSECAGGTCQTKIEEPEKVCSESDSGKDFSNRGITRLNGELQSDTCENEHTLTEYYCEGTQILSESFTCEPSSECTNGACALIPNKCESDSECNDNNACTNDLCSGTPKKCTSTRANEGCSTGLDCMATGVRTKTHYCADNDLQELKSVETECTNNYECQTKFCLQNKCAEEGLFRTIINWFKEIFS